MLIQKKYYDNLKLLTVFVLLFSVKNNIYGNPSPDISNGKRISLSKKGFSIRPPAGWSIDRNFPGVSLLIKPPIEDVVIKRTLQVMRFKGPLYLDDRSVNEFFLKTKKKFETLNSGVGHCKMRDYSYIKTKSGASSILLYVEYLLNDIRMMQAHLLLSSQKNHFVVTYTDTEESISSVSLGFREAWDAMISIGLSNYIGSRYGTYYYFAAFFFLLGLILLVFFLKKRKSQEQELTLGDDEVLS